MRKRAPRATAFQPGDHICGWMILERFDGHYPFMGNYVRFTLDDPHGTELEFWWRQRIDAPHHRRPPGDQSNERMELMT